MISNPPYGKSWKTDQDKMGGKSGITDPRFIIQHAGDPEYSLITRINDGQLLFLANMLSKMKDTPLGSRIAEVHNGSSLFTGDAGQGESNIRRWIIENDWLEAIVALPLNMFYNTGIATYVWVLTNRKPEHRKGYVQLIDATQWYTSLRRNLGQKNCELSSGDAQKICDTSMDFEETEQSKIFPNEAFGYWKVTVERPLRIEGIDPEKAHSAKEIRELRTTGTRSESAPPVIKKVHGRNAVPSPLNGLCEATIKGKPTVVEYEPDTDLRDTEQISLLHEGRDRRLPGKGGTALRARRLVPTGPGEDRVRNQFHPALLQAEAHENAGGDTGRHHSAGAGVRGAAGGDPGKMSSMTMTGLKPFPAYKDSGTPWLGDVPEHWDIAPGKACFSVKKVSNKGMKERTVLSLSYGTIRVRQEEELHGLVPESFETYQIVEPGDIICRPTDLQNDWNSLRFGISRHKGTITSAYICLRTFPRVDTQYGHTLLHAYDLKKIFYGLGSGLRQNLEWEDFKYLPCPIPPLEEQAAIVRYLDDVDQRIRAYVSAKERLIALLEEERKVATEQALRTQRAENLRLQNVANLMRRPIGRNDATTYTPVGLFNRGRGMFLKEPTAGRDLGDSDFYWIQKGDLVISGQFAWEGAIAVAGENDEGCVAATGTPFFSGKMES